MLARLKQRVAYVAANWHAAIPLMGAITVSFASFGLIVSSAAITLEPTWLTVTGGFLLGWALSQILYALMLRRFDEVVRDYDGCVQSYKQSAGEVVVLRTVLHGFGINVDIKDDHRVFVTTDRPVIIDDDETDDAKAVH